MIRVNMGDSYLLASAVSVRYARIVLLLAALPLFGARAYSAEQWQEYEGGTIVRVIAPYWANPYALSIKKGNTFKLKDLHAAEAELQLQLQARLPLYAPQNTFDLKMFVTSVLPIAQISTTGTRTSLVIIFGFQRFLLTEDDTPGMAMDEASTWVPRKSANQLESTLTFRRDQALGDVLGAGYAASEYFPNKGFSLVPSIDGWISVTDSFYMARSKILLDPHRGEVFRRLSCGPAFTLAHLPFSGGEIRESEFIVECNYRFRSSTLESWRSNSRYRIARERIIIPNAPQSDFLENGFQLDLSREISLHGGFIRLAPWADGNHSRNSSSSFRLGGIVRGYQEWSVWKLSGVTTDLTVSTGTSFGPLPVSRAFTGGARFDNLLLEKSLSTEEFLWMGPTLRGYGVSSFHPAPLASTTTAVATSFVGTSLTIGLPGWSRPFFAREGPYHDKLAQVANNLTAEARAHAMDRYLQVETDPRKARQRAEKQIQEEKTTLTNLIKHAKRAALHPILVYDQGLFLSRSGEAISAWSAGGGIRMSLHGGTIEAIYAKNDHSVPQLPSHNLIVRYSTRGNIPFLTSKAP